MRTEYGTVVFVKYFTATIELSSDMLYGEGEQVKLLLFSVKAYCLRLEFLNGRKKIYVFAL